MQTSPQMSPVETTTTPLVDELMTMPGAEKNTPVVKVTPTTSANPLEKLLKKLEEMPAIDHTPAQPTEEKSLPAPEELPELPKETVPEKKTVPTETAEAPHTPDAPFPSWWERYKDMRAAWVLGAANTTLPTVMQDVMDGVKEFLEEVRKRTGRDPKPDETIEEYYNGKENPPSPEISPVAPAKTESQETFPIEEPTEEVLSEWDKMILGEKVADTPSTPIAPSAPVPEVTVKKPTTAPPKRPETPQITRMQEEGAKKPVQVFEAPAPVEKPVPEVSSTPATSSKNIPKKPSPGEGQPVSSHYTGLLNTLMRSHGIDEARWESIKDRPALDVLKEDGSAPLVQYIKELETKNGTSTIAPKEDELLWQYIERLLPH